MKSVHALSKRLAALVLALVLALSAVACGGDNPTTPDTQLPVDEVGSSNEIGTQQPSEEPDGSEGGSAMVGTENSEL